MEDTTLMRELRGLTAPESGKGVCACLRAWLDRGYAPEKLEAALAQPLREACERLLRGETHLSGVLVTARRILEGREYLRSADPQPAGARRTLLLSWPGEMLCHPSHSVTAYLGRALGYEVQDLPRRADPAGLRMTRAGALGLISLSAAPPGGRALAAAVPGNPAEPLPADLELLLRTAGALSSLPLCLQ